MAILVFGCSRIIISILLRGGGRVTRLLVGRPLAIGVGLALFTIVAIQVRCSRSWGLLVRVVRHCFLLRVLLGSWCEAGDDVWKLFRVHSWNCRI